MGMSLETREFLRSITDTPERREEAAFFEHMNEAYGPWKANQDQMERNIAARAAEQEAKKREIEDLAAHRRSINVNTEAMKEMVNRVFDNAAKESTVTETIISNLNDYNAKKKEKEQLESGLISSENCLAAAKAKLEAAEANNDEEAAAAAAKDIEMYTTRVDFYTGQIRRTFAE